MDVEATRKAMGLSRKQLAEKAGVTESTVWSVEHGKNPRGGEAARQAVLQALDPLAGPAESSPETRKPATVGQPSSHRGGKKLAPPEPRADWTYSYEWEGLRPGDSCTVAGEPGVAKFVDHVVTDKGSTHVTVFMSGKWRSFAPDRVSAARKRKRLGPGDGTNGVTDWKLEVTTPSDEVHSLTFATYHDARTQMLNHEVPNGGRCRVINHLGTVVEVAPKGWAVSV